MTLLLAGESTLPLIAVIIELRRTIIGQLFLKNSSQETYFSLESLAPVLEPKSTPP